MRLVAMVIAIALVVSCSDGPKPEPLVVYATAAHATRMQATFDDFTAETGIPISLRFGASGVNAQSVIDNQGSPPADILLTDNVADIWQAADNGALRPIDSQRVSNWPASLVDADQLWFALNPRPAVIAMSDESETPLPLTLDALADPKYRATLCLTTSTLALNRSLMALMIEEKGRRPAELIVRGWMQNLAVPPYETESRLLEALASGTCQFAIVETPPNKTFEFQALALNAHLADAIGVARHARYPESAQQFVDWMLARTHDLTISDVPIGTMGYRDVEAQQLAERARYR